MLTRVSSDEPTEPDILRQPCFLYFVTNSRDVPSPWASHGHFPRMFTTVVMACLFFKRFVNHATKKCEGPFGQLCASNLLLLAPFWPLLALFWTADLAP